MIRSMYTAATGMEAQQFYMDIISNNLANVNTTGYKRSRAEFQDLMYQTMQEPGVRNAEGAMAPVGIEVGLGVKTSATHRIFAQGSLKQTGNALDLAIQGEGFFQVNLPDGQIAYAREGQFKLSKDGLVVTSAGFPLYPQMTVPEGAEEMNVNPNGEGSVMLPGEEMLTPIGQVELVRFINPAGLKSIGNNLFTTSEASGPPIYSMPGENGTGTLMRGYVETSNVKIVDEMVNMITAQRAFEIVSKAIQVSEEMLQVANNLKR